jgi:hypothetical protein
VFICESIPLVSIPFWNDVGLVCVSFATSILNCCKVIDNMHSYIAKVQATMFACFFLLANMLALFSIHLVLPFKWFERDFKGMFHITYLPSSMNMSFYPLHPLLLLMIHLFIFFSHLLQWLYSSLATFFYSNWTFSLFNISWFNMPLCHLQNTLNVMVDKGFLALAFNKQVVCSIIMKDIPLILHVVNP